MATLPHYDTESQSAAAFDAIIDHIGLFNTYSEVPGTLLQPRLGQIDKSVRIDRLLVPNQKLLDLGWRHGIVGVELKRSDARLGPAVAQAMDYTRTVWTMPGSNFAVSTPWVFVFPFPKQHNDMASLMAQNRVGTATTDQWSALHLASGEASVLRATWAGEIRLGFTNSGTKVGSR